jgi:hypothetical protein
VEPAEENDTRDAANESVTDGESDVNAEIARRAYEISQGDDSGTPEENWWRAAAEINSRQGSKVG